MFVFVLCNFDGILFYCHQSQFNNLIIKQQLLKSKKKKYNDIDDYADYLVYRTGVTKTQNVEHTFINSENGKIAIDVLAHKQDAPTIVFIPGTALYSFPFIHFLDRFRQAGYNAIGFDPIGHGRSDGKRGDYSIDGIMDDAKAVIQYAKERFNEKVSVFGSSQGGIVALYLAAENINIDSVICHCFADLTLDENLALTRYPKLLGLLKPGLLKGEKYIPNVNIPVWLYLNIAAIPLKHLGSIQNFVDHDPYALSSISKKALVSLSNTKLAQPIKDIKIPTMVFLGSKDEIFDVSYIEKIFNQLTCKKQLRVFENLGHACFSNQPEEVFQAIDKWLKDIY